MNIIQYTDSTSWDLGVYENLALAKYIKNIIKDKLFEGSLIFSLFPNESICVLYPENFNQDSFKKFTLDVINDLGGIKEAFILHNFVIDPDFSYGQKIVLKQEIIDIFDEDDPYKYETEGAYTDTIKDIEKILNFSYKGIRGEALIFLSEDIALRMTEYSFSFRIKDPNLRFIIRQNLVNGKYGTVVSINNSEQDFKLSSFI